MLNARLVGVTEEDVEGGKELIAEGCGGVGIAPPREESEDGGKRMLLFRCVSRESNGISNLPLGQTRPVFREWMDRVEFSSRGGAFGGLECVFKSEEVAFAVATVVTESKKWLFYLN